MAAIKKTETPKIAIATSATTAAGPVAMKTVLNNDKGDNKKTLVIVGAVVVLTVALILWKRK